MGQKKPESHSRYDLISREDAIHLAGCCGHLVSWNGLNPMSTEIARFPYSPFETHKTMVLSGEKVRKLSPENKAQKFVT